jgi:hypothetical protein
MVITAIDAFDTTMAITASDPSNAITIIKAIIAFNTLIITITSAIYTATCTDDDVTIPALYSSH